MFPKTFHPNAFEQGIVELKRRDKVVRSDSYVSDHGYFPYKMGSCFLHLWFDRHQYKNVGGL
jgi:hypothetical protein